MHQEPSARLEKLYVHCASLGVMLSSSLFLKTSPSVSSSGFVDGGARRMDEAGRRLIPFLDELLAAVKTMVWQQPPVSH